MPTGIGGEIAWWCPSLDDDGNGTTDLNDLSGNGFDLSLDTAAMWEADTDNGGVRAIAGNGTNRDATGAWAQLTGGAERTISLWFKTTSTAGGNDDCVFSYGSNTGGGHLWRMAVEVGQIWLRMSAGRTASWGSVSDYNDGAWHHLLIQLPENGAVEDVDCYVDNVLLAGTYGNGGTAIATTSTDVWLCSDNGVAAFYQGRLDDVRAFGSILSADNRASLASMRAFQPSTGTRPRIGRSHPIGVGPFGPAIG